MHMCSVELTVMGNPSVGKPVDIGMHGGQYCTRCLYSWVHLYRDN